MESFAIVCVVLLVVFVIGFTAELFKEWEWYGGLEGWELLLVNGLLMGFVWTMCSSPLAFGVWGICWLITHLQWVQL